MAKRYTFGWKTVRKVLEKTGGLCWYCDCVLPPDTDYLDDRGCVVSSVRNWDVDHMTPISRGGDHNINNLVPACKTCNNQKRAMTYDEYFEACYAR